ncbi:hypothetical protein B0H10DRAFT_2431035 [Mycena sp. CBHHK59/15]|nr:hypothetical protein B0H10DRAFT_2431035 [Mycena sp. CBHHK59/15]
MSAYNPLDFPVHSFYSETARNPLPVEFTGAIDPRGGCPCSNTAAQRYPSESHTTRYHISHPAQPPYEPSYSPGRFVQPSLHSPSYGFPGAPQMAVPSYGTPSPLARRNSVVDHPPRTRPPISDYSTLSGALNAVPLGPTRCRANSIHKHSMPPYASPARPRRHSVVHDQEPEPTRSHSSKNRRGSEQLGLCLPDGPPDHVRVPQEVFQEPVPPLGYKRIDMHRVPSIAFKSHNTCTPGIRLSHVRGEYFPGLEGSSDRVFENTYGYREIKIRVMWPGYPPNEKRFKTQEGAVTRNFVLMLVASSVKAYISEIKRKKMVATRGFEEWSIGKRPNGRDGIQGDEIVINGIEHRGGANFQPQLWVPKWRMGVP